VKVKTVIGLTAMLAVLTVLVVRDWSSGRAQTVASITLPPPGATEQLQPGCNNVGLTFSDGTASGAVLDAVSPAGSVETMWRHDAAQQRWEGFAPAAPEASDLLTVNFMDAIWLCVVGSPPTATPTATTPTTPAGQTATPASTATPTTSAGHTATPTSTSATPTTPAGHTRTPIAGSPTPGTVSTAVAPTEALDSFRYTMEWTMGTGADTFTMTSAGEFETPDRVDCAITASAGGMTFTTSVIVIGDEAWVDGTPALASEVDGDLRQFCPGSSLFWEDLDLPADLGSIPGQVVHENGVLAVRLSLKGVVESLPALGLIPEGADVQTFDIWVAQDGDWLVALEFDATVDGDPMRIRVDVTNPNDSTISVEPP
jgi:hypothetical protein